MYAIETKGLTRCFGPVQALSGLDLAVPEGGLICSPGRQRRGEIHCDQNSDRSSASHRWRGPGFWGTM